MVDVLKQRRSSCGDRRSVVDLFFWNFTTIIKVVTNFPYIFAGSVSEDYRKERLPSTSVGSLHHTEWRYVRETFGLRVRVRDLT